MPEKNPITSNSVYQSLKETTKAVAAFAKKVKDFVDAIMEVINLVNKAISFILRLPQLLVAETLLFLNQKVQEAKRKAEDEIASSLSSGESDPGIPSNLPVSARGDSQPRKTFNSSFKEGGVPVPTPVKQYEFGATINQALNYASAYSHNSLEYLSKANEYLEAYDKLLASQVKLISEGMSLIDTWLCFIPGLAPTIYILNQLLCFMDQLNRFVEKINSLIFQIQTTLTAYKEMLSSLLSFQDAFDALDLSLASLSQTLQNLFPKGEINDCEMNKVSLTGLVLTATGVLPAVQGALDSANTALNSLRGDLLRQNNKLSSFVDKNLGRLFSSLITPLEEIKIKIKDLHQQVQEKYEELLEEYHLSV